jgi:glycogen operon protein
VHGPYAPEEGHRFNEYKLLLDPYAPAVAGLIKWSNAMFAYAFGGEDADLNKDSTNNAAGLPKSVAVSGDFDWAGDVSPDIPLSESIIYEVHVKGFSKLCSHIPEEMRGSYSGIGSDFAIEYFKKLGVTAVELLPIHHFVNDEHLEKKGLSNYWGYNSLGYFAPHSTYSSRGVLGEQVTEFKEMVKRLHAAGLEVILDVVYNHTGEGNQMGPTLVRWARQRRLLPPCARESALLHGLHRTGKLPEHDASESPPTHHGQSATGFWNARRRIPVRSCLDLGA